MENKGVKSSNMKEKYVFFLGRVKDQKGEK